MLDAELSARAASPGLSGVDPRQFSEASQRFRQSAHELIGLTTSGLQGSPQTQDLARRIASGAHDALDVFVDLLSALPGLTGASPAPRKRPGPARA